jgi:hypothetical protein
LLRVLPVEYVVDAVDCRRRSRPANDIVAVRGWSRDGELALLAGSLKLGINAVIAYAPSCYVGREQNEVNDFARPAAAFTRRGAPVDSVPLPDAMRADTAKPCLEDLHGITVERIAGPVMLASGMADTGLYGTTPEYSCARAMRRLDLFGVRVPHVHLSYGDAGQRRGGHHHSRAVRTREARGRPPGCCRLLAADARLFEGRCDRGVTLEEQGILLCGF